ncbi:replication initiator [Streptomyces bauhiniae]|uniref:replication initiator n=1 Tax=Streptomyces bauhiniae TaxID=2340725 RepID=UPI0033BBDBD6
MIRTSWELGKMPEFTGLKLCKWAHMPGFRGRFSTKPRSYSTTLGALRDARRTKQARATPAFPSTTLVVGHWDYLGSSYSPGAALPAPGRPLGGSRIRPRPGLRQEEAPGDRAAPSVSAAARSCCR